MSTDSDVCSLQTLTHSLARALYRYVGGRRRQASNIDYEWPYDSTATTLERLTADVFERTYENRLYPESAPGRLERILALSSTEDPPRMIDLGSGATASWAISMAERFPQVECTAVDLIPCDVQFIPPNLSIEIFDLLKGLPYPEDYFNLVHCRLSSASFLENPELDFIGEIVRTLRPRRVLILQELDDPSAPFHSLTPNNPYLTLLNGRLAHRLPSSPFPTPTSPSTSSWSSRMHTRLLLLPNLNPTSILSGPIVFPLAFDPSLRPHQQQQQQQQLGPLVREAWLTTLELMSAALGWDEARIRRERKKDEEAMPLREVGLRTRIGVVCAEKRGGGEREEDEVMKQGREREWEEHVWVDAGARGRGARRSLVLDRAGRDGEHKDAERRRRRREALDIWS